MKRLEESKSEFAQETKKMMAAMSPLSLAVVFEQIKRGSMMDAKQVFEMEFRISQGFVNHTEFFEGIRALLVEKDRKP
jgi:enoyl-CoA hydratase/carnithine racemase